MKVMRVSEYYSLGLEQPSLDFVDVMLDTDVPLFVDPTALYLLDTKWGDECRSLISDYFSLVLEHIRGSEYDKAEELLANLSEPNETHLGLSTTRSRGHGMGSKLAEKLCHSLKESQAVRTGLITNLEDTALMIEGIASDVISDIVTNIIREPLLKYTEDMARHYGMGLVEGVASRPLWDARLRRWDVKYVTQLRPDGERLMLVPRSIVRRSITYDAGKYYNSYLLEQLQEEAMAKGLVRILKNGDSRPPTKKSLKEERVLATGGVIAIKKENRALTPDRRNVLRRYKEDSKNKPKPALSHSEMSETIETPKPDWDKLLNDLLSINPGGKDAKKYEKAVQALLDALFCPWFMYPKSQTPLENRRKIVDITYFNAARDGFFKWLKDNYSAAYIFIECKNYSDDVSNPELDQLAGRFSIRRGKVGILVSRKIKNRKLVTEKCRDSANADRGFIIAIDDDDIKVIVDAVRNEPPGEPLKILRERFDELVL